MATTQLNPIEAHERSIGRILSDDYAFEIPPYQRPYAWEEDQTRELLTDLLDAMDNTDPGQGREVIVNNRSEPGDRRGRRATTVSTRRRKPSHRPNLILHLPVLPSRRGTGGRLDQVMVILLLPTNSCRTRHCLNRHSLGDPNPFIR